jgi:hypothetical protein
MIFALVKTDWAIIIWIALSLKKLTIFNELIYLIIDIRFTGG